MVMTVSAPTWATVYGVPGVQVHAVALGQAEVHHPVEARRRRAVEEVGAGAAAHGVVAACRPT